MTVPLENATSLSIHSKIFAGGDEMGTLLRFRALVTAGWDIVYRVSPDWSEMYYLQGRDFIADTYEPTRNWLEKYIPLYEQPKVKTAIRKAVLTKNVFKLEHRILRTDGSVGWTLSRAVPILDTQGKVVEWFGAASDITSRKQAEEALRISQAESERQRRLYEAILNNTPDLAYVFDINHHFIYANEVLLKMWGRTREEALGKTFLELGYEAWHAAMHDREIEQVIATKKPLRGEAPFTGTFGRRIYEYIFVPVLGEDGKVEAIAGTTRDVTERKKVEEALRSHSKQFETLLNAAPLGVFLVDADFRICQVNPVALPILGDIPGGLLNRDFSEIIHHLWPKDHADEVVNIFRRTLEIGEPYFTPECAEFRIDRKVMEYYEWRTERIILSDGRFGLVCYFRDISQQVQSREAIAEARDKAEAASHAKSEFLANMSHEIRTPMNAVVGLSGILAMDTALSSKQKEMVNTLQLSAQSLLGLINDLLDIAKIETNQIELEHIPFTLGEIIGEIFGMLSVKACEKGITLEHDDSVVDQKRFMGDPLRIKQILMNLISNAVKFTEKGRVTVSITTSPQQEPNHTYVHVIVSDTGIGIASDKLEGIFEKFTQGDTSTTRKYGGTGLGLAISRNLAEIMGGGITAKSVLGKGSEFTLHLPLELAGISETHSASHGNNTPEKPETDTIHGHILLVEDYKPNVMVAAHMVESLGYTFDIATNGEDALAKIQTGRNRYDAVLMDVQMPDMDGFEATQIIRREEKAKQLPRLPIIAITAHALQGDRERCLEAGMDQYISKPFQMNELKAILKRYSARGNVAESPQPQG